MNGEGRLTWADGKLYKGQWKDDKKHGYGEYLWDDGRKHRGEWKENR
jgi:hypothetical protein